MVSSYVGSFISTFWNLLSNALSFSILVLYSKVVVEPINFSFPLAKAGFNMLDASIAPSAPPAPTMPCISSINRIISSEASISFIRVFSFSSNSPLYFVPAIRVPKFIL